MGILRVLSPRAIYEWAEQPSLGRTPTRTSSSLPEVRSLAGIFKNSLVAGKFRKNLKNPIYYGFWCKAVLLLIFRATVASGRLWRAFFPHGTSLNSRTDLRKRCGSWSGKSHRRSLYNSNHNNQLKNAIINYLTKCKILWMPCTWRFIAEKLAREARRPCKYPVYMKQKLNSEFND